MFKIKDWTNLLQRVKSPLNNEVMPNELDNLFLGLTTDGIFIVATETEMHSVNVSLFISEASSDNKKHWFEVEPSVTSVGKTDLPRPLYYLWECPTNGSINAAFQSKTQAVLDFY